MLEGINKEIIQCKKAGDKLKANALILVKAVLVKNQKNRKPVKEQAVVQAHRSNLEKSLKFYEGTDKYDELKREVEIVKALLPTELAPEDVEKAVLSYLTANPEHDMGQVMRYLKAQLGAHNARNVALCVKKHLK